MGGLSGTNKKLWTCYKARSRYCNLHCNKTIFLLEFFLNYTLKVTNGRLSAGLFQDESPKGISTYILFYLSDLSTFFKVGSFPDDLSFFFGRHSFLIAKRTSLQCRGLLTVVVKKYSDGAIMRFYWNFISAIKVLFFDFLFLFFLQCHPSQRGALGLRPQSATQFARAPKVKLNMQMFMQIATLWLLSAVRGNFVGSRRPSFRLRS